MISSLDNNLLKWGMLSSVYCDASSTDVFSASLNNFLNLSALLLVGFVCKDLLEPH